MDAVSAALQLGTVAAAKSSKRARENLLVQAAVRGAQLANQLRVDAANLDSPELAKAAEALKNCARAAERLANNLSDRRQS